MKAEHRRRLKSLIRIVGQMSRLVKIMSVILVVVEVEDMLSIVPHVQKATHSLSIFRTNYDASLVTVRPSQWGRKTVKAFCE